MDMVRFKMMFKLSVYFLAIFCMVACTKEVAYVKYIPIVIEEKEGTLLFTARRDMLTEKHKKNFKKVLKFYNLSFIETNDGEILISDKLNSNKEYLMNLTKKANDVEFLQKLDRMNIKP